MGSIEHRLGERHLAGCIALAKSANWNQNEADWRLMLGFGRGWGIALEDGTLAASTLVLPYNGFAWVAMVLVLPEHRKRGFATRLLRTVLADLKKKGQTAILDATPAGHDVYAQEGFNDCWGFKRFALNSLSKDFSSKGKTRPIANNDWPSILQLDAIAFGASRETVLRNLAARLPEAALVAERGGKVAGFLLGRDGREARQLGPLVAQDEQTARDLLELALRKVGAPIYIDVTDRASNLQSWILARGFVFQRPFTRMVHGATAEAARAPGDASLVFCPAGPELG